MAKLRRCKGAWAFCDGECSRCNITATTQTSMVYLIQPTADVVERKKGKWTEREVIEDGKVIEEWQSARCSVCGKYHTTPYMYYFYDFAYCPNCGAEMERRDDV